MSSDLDEIIFGIGPRFAEERERLGYTQGQLATRLATTERTLIDYESSKTPPKVPKLLLFWGIGADILYILTGERGPIEEGDEAPPASNLAAAMIGLTLSEEDADLVLALARRLAGR